MALMPSLLFAQEDEKGDRFEWGISVGVHFPGDSSAGFYNGDAPDGRIEDLLGRRRIRRDVREELGQDFEFAGYTPRSEMSYQTSYSVGLNARYIPEGSDLSIHGELLYSRLESEEFFFLLIEKPGQPVPEEEPFPVNGQEERFHFLLDLHKEGSGKPLRTFARAGGTIGYAEASKNRISIQGLSYSILPSSDPRYGDREIQQGLVYGGQGELGIKLVTDSEWDISLSGRLSYAKVGIGPSPGFDWHGGLFFRLLRRSS